MDNLRQYHSTLNRLLLAQLYRTDACRKAAEITADADLRRFFQANVRSGERWIEELTLTILPQYVTDADDTTLPAAYQHHWAALPDTLYGASRNAVLDKYLQGETLTLGLYHDALQHASAFPTDGHAVLHRHRAELMRLTDQARHLKPSRFRPVMRRLTQIRQYIFARRVVIQ